MKQTKDLAQQIEEARLHFLDKKEKIVREDSRDEIIEAGQKLTLPSDLIQLSNRKTIEQVLAEQGVLSKKATSPLSPKAKRSKRYYIRNRIESGKPYIPQRIRALGKKRAKELGYNDWERREIKQEEVEIGRTKEILVKLGVFSRLIIRTRLKFYFERLRNE